MQEGTVKFFNETKGFGFISPSAGFVFDILGAAASMVLIGDLTGALMTSAMFLPVIFLSYFLWKKTQQ